MQVNDRACTIFFLENTSSSYRSLSRAEPKPPSKEVDSRDKLFLNKNSFDFGCFKQINSRRRAPVNLTNIIDYSPNILCNNIDLDSTAGFLRKFI